MYLVNGMGKPWSTCWSNVCSMFRAQYSKEFEFEFESSPAVHPMRGLKWMHRLLRSSNTNTVLIWVMEVMEGSSELEWERKGSHEGERGELLLVQNVHVFRNASTGMLHYLYKIASGIPLSEMTG